MPEIAPYGTWMSPIDAERTLQGYVAFNQPRYSDGELYWAEVRPDEGGRQALVKRAADGSIGDILPADMQVRTMAHEYGGGDYLVHDRVVYFSNFADQRLYRVSTGNGPEPITPAPPQPRSVRFADGLMDPNNRIVAVRETHFEDREPANELVAIPSDGSGEPSVLATGSDFVSTPRLSPDGSQLAWLTWDHPRMPWEGTDLWVAELGGDGSLGEPLHIAGGPTESIYQPEWGTAGALYFVSDRTGWWNLFRWDPDGFSSVLEMEADFGDPQWQFGQSSYQPLADDRLVVSYHESGLHRLGVIGGGALSPSGLDYTLYRGISTDGQGRVGFVGYHPAKMRELVEWDVASGEASVVRANEDSGVSSGYVSVPEPVTFETADRDVAHAFFYPPANQDFAGPDDELPPLIVMCHGGPTAATVAALSFDTVYWTSRGFAVADVNYRGSTGYGRGYREKLRGEWGIVDVVDCVDVARHLAAEGLVDGDRLAIRGGSAGGYVVLASLAFHDTFTAGASYFGVSDIEALMRDTHKFESRYDQFLVDGDVTKMRERSPIHFADQIDSPLILFQGLEDKVVPPSQAESIVRAMEERGIPHAYITYEGEDHGFRDAKNIAHSLESELYFYGRIFGFDPADDLSPIRIENADD